jgi:DNA repair protein RecN (Recombination protein N)
MLIRLSIDNYILIDTLQFSPKQGLTVITGETGAGKSVFLGALNLLMGARNEGRSLFDENRKCVIEAEFQLNDQELKPLFEEEGIDFDTFTIVRREILPNQKSRSFVNDTPVTLPFLKALSSKLIDFNSQHQTLQLLDQDFQRSVIDHLANNSGLLEQYRTEYLSWKAAEKELLLRREQKEKQEKEADYLRFLLEEIDRLNIQSTHELSDLEAELSVLSHAESIIQKTTELSNQMRESEHSILSSMAVAISQLNGIRSLSSELTDLYERLKSVHEELKDWTNEIERYGNTVQSEPERLQQLNDKVAAYYRLFQKHRISDSSTLIQLAEEWRVQLDGIGNPEAEIQRLEKESVAHYEQAKALAQAIHEARIGVLPEIEKDVKQRFAEIGLKDAV